MSVYALVTERIVKMLEAGNIPWKCPWIFHGARNFENRPYSLINQILLCDTGPGIYGTYTQWTQRGGRIKRGARAGTITFWKIDETIKDDGEIIRRPVLRYYKVFHESMIVGIELPEQEKTLPFEPDVSSALQALEVYVQREGIALEEVSSNEAYFDPSRDLIHLPSREQFKKSSADLNAVFFVGTFAHEAIHSSGTQERLNRKSLSKFGSSEYAREELVAEIGSSLFLAKHGIDTRETVANSTAYIQSWMQAIKQDDHVIVNAASAAERAVDFILGEDNQ